MLDSRGAVPDEANHLVQHASRFQKAEIVRELLKNRDQVNLQDKDKRALVHYAAWFGEVSPFENYAGRFLVNLLIARPDSLHFAAFHGSAAGSDCDD